MAKRGRQGIFTDEAVNLSLALGQPIDRLDLETRTENALRRREVLTVGDLLVYAEVTGLRVPYGVGAKGEADTLAKLRSYLEKEGLRWLMKEEADGKD